MSLETDLANLAKRVEKLEALHGVTPTPDPLPVRADTLARVIAAISAGSKHIQTLGFTLSETLDAEGALIELIKGGPNWKPAISLRGGRILNATIATPPTEYTNGRRTFWKAIETSGTCHVESVTFAPGIGFCLHIGGKSLVSLDQVKATTFSEYFVFQEAGSHVEASGVEVLGGSSAESVWRVGMASYVIEDSTLDNSLGSKSALRGDCPPTSTGQPGGIVRRSKIVGEIGPCPLTEDDGGQMNGIDRFRVDGGYLQQLDASKKPEAIAFAQAIKAQGKTKREIVRACADRWFPGQVSEHEIDLTIELRDQDVGRRSYARIEDSEIIGALRINARMTLELVRTTITGDQPISGNSQITYPWPIDRVIDANESAPPPRVSLSSSSIKYGKTLGIDLMKWPTVTMDQASAIKKIATE